MTRFLRILLDEEVKDLEKPESKFEQARLAYDAVYTEVETARKKDLKAAKLQAAEEKEKEARRKFELVGQEMRDDMAVRPKRNVSPCCRIRSRCLSFRRN